MVILTPLMALGCASSSQPRIEVLPANQVFISRVIPEDSVAREGGCSVKTLDHPPGPGMRELGAIHLAGMVPNAADVIALVDQKACEMGADAVLIAQIQEQSAGDGVNYDVTARAFAAAHGGQPPEGGRGTVIEVETGGNQTATVGMNPRESASGQASQSSLEAPVVTMHSGGEESQQQMQSGNGADASQGEVLMRPASPDENGGGTGAQSEDNGGGAPAISESSIPPTEAAPLSAEPSPLASPPEPLSPSASGASPERSPAPRSSADAESPTPIAAASPAPSPTSSPLATPSESPTPEQSPSNAPIASPAASESPSPSPSASPSPNPSATETSQPSSATPAETESPSPSASATPTAEASAATPSDTPTQSDMPTPSVAPSDTPAPETTAAPPSGGQSPTP